MSSLAQWKTIMPMKCPHNDRHTNSCVCERERETCVIFNRMIKN